MKMEKRIHNKRSRGFTLIELLMGLAISILVMAALIDVFNSQQKVYAQQSALAKEQAAARTAIAQLSRDFRMAGYTGVPLGNDQLTLEASVHKYFPVVSIMDNAGAGQDIKTKSGSNLVDYTTGIISDLTTLQLGSSTDVIEIRGNFNRRTTTLPAAVMTGATKIPVTDPSLFNGTGFNRPGWIMVAQTGMQIITDIYPIVPGADLSATNEIPIGLATTNSYLRLSETIVAPIFSRVYFATPHNPSLPRNWRNRLYVANYIPTADNTSVIMSPALNLTTGAGPQEFAVDISGFQINYDLDQRVAFQVTNDQSMVCDPCQIRGISIHLWTATDRTRYQNKKVVARDFSMTVRVRNIGFDTTTCPITAAPCGWGY
jgi:prepilin-type N-terminal cleavage/methylation domain-containing protein